MSFLEGLRYNLRGFWTGVRNGKLLFWGLFRFFFVLAITVLTAGLILVHHQEILNALWARPESVWVLWLWHLLSWALSLVLVAVSILFSYLVSQILFSVLIMDLMSRITERMVTGSVQEETTLSLPALFVFLIKQEIPRALVPVALSLLLMLLGWFTPLGPVLVPLSSALAIVFLAWDNTDLTPARRALPFRTRWRFLMRTLVFHLGFGLPFLIPGLNLLFLAFAPVGATLYYVRGEREPKRVQTEVPGSGETP